MSSKPTMLFRHSPEVNDEYEIAKKYFNVQTSRILVPEDDHCVVGRYSVLPFYKELVHDLYEKRSRLINSYNQHKYIANFEYYEDVKEYTPKTWFRLEDVPKDGGPFVVKGRTNSRKNEWRTKMFAKDCKTAANIYCDLSIDPMIQDQGVIVRQYEDFTILEQGVNGQPFLNEWRFFYFKRMLLSRGFYWTQCSTEGKMTVDGIMFADQIAKIIASHVNFFVLDIAEKPDGTWRLIEINDGQMSGLSNNSPDLLYKNLAREINATR